MKDGPRGRPAPEVDLVARHGRETTLTAWEARILDRQAQVRGLYLAQAQLLQRSSDPADHQLGANVEAFVNSMPRPDSQRLALARELRAANTKLREGIERDRGRRP